MCEQTVDLISSPMLIEPVVVIVVLVVEVVVEVVVAVVVIVDGNQQENQL